jgi:hypothetical protein
MMEAVGTSETSIYFKTTCSDIPEGCHLHLGKRPPDRLKQRWKDNIGNGIDLIELGCKNYEVD